MIAPVVLEMTKGVRTVWLVALSGTIPSCPVSVFADTTLEGGLDSLLLSVLCLNKLLWHHLFTQGCFVVT